MSAKLDNTKTLVGVVLGAVVVVVAAWFLLVSPERSKALKLNDDISSMQQRIDERSAALATPHAAVTVRASDVFRLTRAMPNSTDMSGIIVALNRLAAGHDLQFKSIQPSSLVAQTGFNVQPIDIVLQGRFGDVSDFLGSVRKLVKVQKHRLAAAGRLFSVDSIEFAKPDGAKESFPLVKATLTVDAFVFAGGALNNSSTQPTPSAPSGTVAAGAN
jgi:Tfp pilus assembly protein PilO